MSRRVCLLCAALVAISLSTSRAADLTAGMKKGKPDIKSAGAATFAPQGILLVGDTRGAKIFAIATGDSGSNAGQAINLELINEKIAGLLGTTSQQIIINDLAVNPESGNAFLTVSRGTGPDAQPVIVRVEPSGKINELALTDVSYSQAEIPNAPSADRQRQSVTTDLQFSNGQVIVAGLSNEEFASTLRVIPFPFADVNKGASVEIWHAAHGGFETRSPVNTFAVFDIAGQANVLAAYTCTPLVKFPLDDLTPGKKVRGTTLAELGSGNKPLDMVVYEKGGKNYLLLTNNNRGVMKIALENIEKANGIVDPVRERGGTAGLPYETLSELKGVNQLDRLDKAHALLLVQGDSGGMNLKTIDLP